MTDLSAYEGNLLFETLVQEVQAVAETDEIELTEEQVKELAVKMHVYYSDTMSAVIRAIMGVYLHA